MKILIFALSGIGDALMFTPALQLLRKNYPESEMDILCMFSGVKDILSQNKNVNNIIFFEFLNQGFLKSLKFLLGLRNKYDITINVYPSNRKEYNIFSFLVGAEKRAAVRYLRKDISNLGFLNNLTIKENDLLHNVEENVKLVEKICNKEASEITNLEFLYSENEIKTAEEFLIQKGISQDQIVIGFHPGCATMKNHIKRRWEPEKFIGLGKKLIENHNAKIFVFGGKDEKELKDFIVNGINSPNSFSIKMNDLAQTAALMKRCNVFITNDSSLMHIASSLSLNTVAIIGPTNINYIHPWKTNYRIVSLNLACSPCFYYSPRPLKCIRKDVKFKCIKELGIEMVYKEALEYLN